jgi:hypothetical protein
MPNYLECKRKRDGRKVSETYDNDESPKQCIDNVYGRKLELEKTRVSTTRATTKDALDRRT